MDSNKDFIETPLFDPETVNPLGLEAGKEYWLKYTPAKNSPWRKVKITHFTVNGHPWQVAPNTSGIVSPGFYEKMDITPESELLAEARDFLTNKGMGGLVNTSQFPELLAEFYNSVNPKYSEKV